MLLAILAFATGFLGSPDPWLRSANVRIEKVAEGLRFATTNDAPAWISYHWPVPEAMHGRHIRFELDVLNVSPLAWPFKGRIEQLDAHGRVLAEHAVDTRFVSYLLPPDKTLELREPGHIRRDARELKIAFELRGLNPRFAGYDNFGRPLKATGDACRAVLMTRLAVVPTGERRPVPPDAAKHLRDGVLSLDGDSVFWYAVRSQASWGRGLDDKRLGNRYFPADEGAMEAWFKPAARGKRRLLEASDHSWSLMFREPDDRDVGTLLAVDLDLEPDAWHKVAVTWRRGGEKRIFVDGACVSSEPFTNRMDHVAEVYVGGGHVGGRVEPKAVRRRYGRVFFKGQVRDLRVTGPDGRVFARFPFADTLDGVSSVGAGWIPGTLRFPTPYVPSFDKENFRELPTGEDLARGWKRGSAVTEVRPGDSFEMSAPTGVVVDAVEIVNRGGTDLVAPLVLNAGEVDTRSWGDMGVTLGTDVNSDLSDREKADRIFQFLVRKNDYFMNHPVWFAPDTDVPNVIEYRSIRQFNTVGLLECVPLNLLATRAFLHAGGLPASELGGYGHGFGGVHYDGRHHVYDLSARESFLGADGVPLSLADLEDAPGPIFAAGGSAEYYVRFTSRRHWFEWPHYLPRFVQTLRPGERYVLYRGNDGNMVDLQWSAYFDSYFTRHRGNIMPREDYTERCGASVGKERRVWRVDRFFPDYANAFLTYDGDPVRVASETTPSNFVYRVLTAYLVVAGRYRAEMKDGSAATLSLSTDGGRSWRPLARDETGAARAVYEVRGRTGYRIRVNAPLEQVVRLTASTELEANRRLLTGNLKDGPNRLRFLADAGEAAAVRIAWREPGKAVSVPEAVDSGVVRGFERHVVVREGEKQSVSFEVRKASDGSEKVLTVVSASGVRLLRGPKTLVKKGDAVTFDCVLPAGRYAVFSLERFASHEAFPTEPKGVLSAGGAEVAALRPINDACMLHKQTYGRRGGRGAWLWSYPTYGHYPYMGLKEIEIQTTESLSFRLMEDLVEGPLEIGAVLVVPDPEREFANALVKNLCGLVTAPWMTEQDGLGAR